MTFSTPSQAKRFFVEKLAGQAEMEGLNLSRAERYMLTWSSDPDFEPDLQLASDLEKQISDADFEAKIAGLIRRAYARDVAADKGLKHQYRAAYSKVTEGDHYIVVMIDRALGLKVKSWWPF